MGTDDDETVIAGYRVGSVEPDCSSCRGPTAGPETSSAGTCGALSLHQRWRAVHLAL